MEIVREGTLESIALEGVCRQCNCKVRCLSDESCVKKSQYVPQMMWEQYTTTCPTQGCGSEIQLRPVKAATEAKPQSPVDYGGRAMLVMTSAFAFALVASVLFVLWQRM